MVRTLSLFSFKRQFEAAPVLQLSQHRGGLAGKRASVVGGGSHEGGLVFLFIDAGKVITDIFF